MGDKLYGPQGVSKGNNKDFHRVYLTSCLERVYGALVTVKKERKPKSEYFRVLPGKEVIDRV